MKELSHEDWMKNPTPRMMWVWDSDKSNRIQAKVIYFSENDVEYPVIVLKYNSTGIFRHCAEIEKPKTRRMTNKEFSRWLREKPTREYKFSNYINIYDAYDYTENDQNDEVDDTILIRENDSEWREPLVEVEE